MRIVLTIIIAMVWTTVFSFIWWITQPILLTTTTITQAITIAGAWNTTGSDQTYMLIRLMGNIGIAVCIIFIWIWAIVSVQAEDWRSDEYGY